MLGHVHRNIKDVSGALVELVVDFSRRTLQECLTTKGDKTENDVGNNI